MEKGRGGGGVRERWAERAREENGWDQVKSRRKVGIEKERRRIEGRRGGEVQKGGKGGEGERSRRGKNGSG